MLIRYYSDAGRLTGYGKAATEMAMALASDPDLELDLVRIPVQPGTTRGQLVSYGRFFELDEFWRATGTSSPADQERLDRAHPKPDLVIVHTLPRDCLDVANADHCFELGVPVIAYTTWEGLIMPEAVAARLAPFHQVWVPSECNARAVPGAVVVPHAYDVDQPRPARQTQDGARYRFYWIGAWAPRKNPVGLIRAYCHAFSHADDVELVIRSSPSRVTDYVAALASSGFEQSHAPLVTLLRESLTEQEILQLHADCDCYVSASRGEAWDLSAFDAMLARRMIICPEHSGATEFLGNTGRWGPGSNLTNAVRTRSRPAPAELGVEVDVVRVGVGTAYRTVVTGPTEMTAHDLWWEPDLLELATQMREVYRERQRELVVNYDPPTKFSYQAVAHRAVDLCKTLLAKGSSDV